MDVVTATYGRRHQKGMSAITTVAMTAFHVGAVAALFFINCGRHPHRDRAVRASPACSASAWATTAC